MRGWLLDTNVVTELARQRPDPRVAAWVAPLARRSLYISVLTLAEYDKGIENLPADSSARARIEAAVAALEFEFAGRVLAVGNAIMRRWGRLSGQIQRTAGKAPPVIDTLLAATAIEHDLCLVTRNVRDVRDTGARVFDPWTDDPRAMS